MEASDRQYKHMHPSINNVTAYPFLSTSEFIQACEAIQTVSDYIFLKTSDPILRYIKTTSTYPQPSLAHETLDPDEFDEIDEAAVIHRLDEEVACSKVIYDIVLSPTYRVPVVYIYGDILRRASILTSDPNHDIHSLLIPEHYRSAVQQTGTIGALTMTEHPSTGLPAYFLHPCRTADAMRDCWIDAAAPAAATADGVSPVDYMMLWFGIIGASVGLYLPAEVALRAQDCA